MEPPLRKPLFHEILQWNLHHICMDYKKSQFCKKKLKMLYCFKRAANPRWPLTPRLLRSHVWLYPKIIVYKSHENISKYVDTVTLCAKTWTKVHWPQMTSDPTSVEVTCVTLPKDHCVPLCHVCTVGLSTVAGHFGIDLIYFACFYHFVSYLSPLGIDGPTNWLICAWLLVFVWPAVLCLFALFYSLLYVFCKMPWDLGYRRSKRTVSLLFYYPLVNYFSVIHTFT